MGRLLGWGAVVGAGWALWRGWEAAPGWVLGTLVTAIWPLARAWRGARGTALGSAVAWAAVAVGLGLAAQVAALGEPLASGRPVAGHWAYLAMLTALAAVLSVLNARRPGSGAWALLMALLVLVFLIPWLEGGGLGGRAGAWGRLRLDAPWTLFYAMLGLAGVTNYLPTRYGPASAWLALALGLEYLGLTRADWSRPARGLIWSAGPWALAGALWTAEARSPRRPPGRPGLERLWLWFRDRWGVVWALRVRERFNRAAEAAGWPIRLAWEGPVPAPGSDPMERPPAATATLRGLLRRFADPARLDEAADPGPSGRGDP